jgi:hypothetical protein
MRSPDVRRVSIELSREQVDQVLRDASGTRHASLLIGALPHVRDAFDRAPSLLQCARLSRSLLAAGLLERDPSTREYRLAHAQ